MNNPTQQHYDIKNQYNVLFLPGLPGEYKDRPLIDDLMKLKSNIYSVTYPGTYGNSSILSPSTTIESIRTAAQSLLTSGLPLLVISYSYSTLFVADALKDLTGIMGILLFSPIFDLKSSINSDFKNECERLNDTDDFQIDYSSFAEYTQSTNDYALTYDYKIKILMALNAPIIYAVGGSDPVIKNTHITQHLQAFRLEHSYNDIVVCELPSGEHKLDSLYETGELRRLIHGIYFSHEVAVRFPESTVYSWGASLNYKYSGDKTDIDLAIIGRSFDYDDYIYLNKLVNDFGNKHNVIIDIVVNTFSELMTKEKIRSNRGPSFIHELAYYYVPLRFGDKFDYAVITPQDIIDDAVFANETNIYKSKKALLNYMPGSSASNWIFKDFLIGCYYDQYSKGNLRVDQNNIDLYYKESSPKIYTLLRQLKELKQNGYHNVTLEQLKEVLEAHETLV